VTKQEAINHFGSAKSLAEALGVKPQAVSQWSQIPARRQYELERLTNGGLKVDEELIGSAA